MIKKIYIYGAGVAGRQLLKIVRERSDSYNPVAWIDDDTQKVGAIIDGLKVLSLNEFHAEGGKGASDTFSPEIFVAVPSAQRAKRVDIIEGLLSSGYKVRSLPGVEDILDGVVTIKELNEIHVEDLLGRLEVAHRNSFENQRIFRKNVLVTGGAGSIGSELCRQILSQQPNCIVIFDQNEFSLYSISDEFEGLRHANVNCNIVAVLGSITDKEMVKRVLEKYSIQTIFHAAAYKHVPLVEANIANSVFNNVYGTLCLCTAAIDLSVESMTLISSDKAVRPTNVMGASKRVCELIMQANAAITSSTILSMVRFGNVLNSSGSVIPKFKKQLSQGGPLTVTHRDITRYFMSIEEAASLVLRSSSIAEGGEVFLLDMGEEVRIFDMAKKFISLSGYEYSSSNKENSIGIVLTGLRPGEKLHEELLVSGDLKPTSIEKIYFGKEEFLELEELRLFLDELLAKCNEGDDNGVLILLERVVAGYRPDL